MVTPDLARLFPGLRESAIAAAAPKFYTLEVGKGVVVVEEGEHDAAVLFLLEGNVAIRTGEFEIATVGPGGIVGEIGLFGGQMRIASVLAIKPCVFLVLDRKDFEGLLDQSNPIAYRIEAMALEQLVQRLRLVDERIAAFGEKGEKTVDAVESNGKPVKATLDRLAILSKNPLFEGVPIGALDDVALRMDPRGFDDGDVLCKEGSPGDDLYVLVDGHVEVTARNDHGSTDVLGLLEGGDVFGMASVVQDRPRMATCTAKGPVTALRMGREEAREMIQSESRSGSVLRIAMIRALADQIAFANSQFAKMSMERKRRTAEKLAKLGIEVHGRHNSAGNSISPIQRGDGT